MKGLIKCRMYFVSFFIISGLLLSVLLPAYTVHASSDYDGLVQTTDQLWLGNDAADVDSYQITGDYLNIMQDQCPTQYSEFTSSFTSGSWAIIQARETENVDDVGHNNIVYIFWETDAVSNLSFQNISGINRIVLDHADGGVQLFNNGAEDCISLGESTNLNVVSDITPLSQFYVSTFDVTYPTGYEGTNIPSSPGDVITITPDLVYLVEDRKLKLTPATSLYSKLQQSGIPLYPNDGYITYHLQKCNEDWEDCENVDFHENIIETTSYEFTVSEYGHYQILAGYTFPSPVPPPIPPEGSSFDYAPFQFKWNVDGTSFSGASNDQDCTDLYCPQNTPYEDCSSFGTDLIGGFGCNLRNFGTWIVAQIKFLFIPSSKQLSDLYGNFNNKMQEKFGLLLYPFTWISNVFESFGDTANTCTPNNTAGLPSANIGGTFFGSSVSINPCSAETQFPAIYNFVVFIVRVLAVVAMIFAVFRKLRSTLNNQQEVAT